MTEPFLTIDDLTEYLGHLPDWYIQVLEARERNACDICPEDEIEIKLTDFSGKPISGEPWFVFMENTNGSAVSYVNTDVDPFLNGAGQTTPSRLILNPAAHILDVAFGGQTPMTLNLTDAELGEEYEEQLYIFDTPAEYDGPLSLPSAIPALVQTADGHLREIAQADANGIPSDAIADMMGELDLAVRAAAGLFEDLSITARNAVEATLVLAIQNRPPNAHKLPGVELHYGDVESLFPQYHPAIFVGPDGAPYADAGFVASRMGASREWSLMVVLLELLSDPASVRSRESEGGIGSFLDNLIASPAHAGQGRGGGGRVRLPRGGLPSRGKGSNPDRKPTGRNGHTAHTQAHTRRPVKSGKTLRFMGVKVRLDRRFREHMSPGHGIKKGDVKGTHVEAEFLSLVRAAGGQTRVIGNPHPANSQIVRYEYRLPKADGSGFKNWRPKTVYSMRTETFMNLARQALRNALVKNGGTLPANGWSGVTRTGISISGYAEQIGPHTYRVSTAYFSPW